MFRISKLRPLFSPLAALILAASLGGCTALTNWFARTPVAPQGKSVSLLSTSVKTTPINEVLQQQSIDAVVHLKGKVGRQAPLLSQSAYELSDPSGSIWVLTTRPVPQTGKEVVIRAIVRYRSIPQGKTNIGEFYLEEQEQLASEGA